MNGLNADGTAKQKFGYISADAAKAYYTNLSSKDTLAKTKTAGGKLADAGVSGAKTENGVGKGFYKAGDQSGAGYNLGITSDKNILKYKKSSKVVATTTLAALKNFLGIKSPSRKFALLGDYSAQGYAKGITENTYKATSAVKAMGEKAVDTMRKASAVSNNVITGSNISIPTSTNAGYAVSASNEGAMASLASNIYQAVVSGMASANIGTGNGGDIKVIIDGKEVFKAVQTESRKRGVAISNGAFSR